MKISLPRDVVMRILLRLSSRFQFADLTRLTAVNRSLWCAFEDERGVVREAFHGKAPALTGSSELRFGLVEELVQLFKAWEKQPADPARSASQAQAQPGALSSARILAWATLCSSHPALLKAKSIKQLDLVLIGLRLSIGMNVESAMAQFDRIPHLKLVYYLRDRGAQEFQHIDHLESGDLANFAPALAGALNDLPSRAGSQVAQWMQRLVAARGVGIPTIRAGYFALMNRVLENLHKLASGKEQARILDRWIERFPHWALPRLERLLIVSIREDGDIATLVRASPQQKWRAKYQHLQAVFSHLLASDWGLHESRREPFLAEVALSLALPPDYVLEMDGIAAEDAGFPAHQVKMSIWLARHETSRAVRLAGFSVTDENSDSQLDEGEGFNCVLS